MFAGSGQARSRPMLTKCARKCAREAFVGKTASKRRAEALKAEAIGVKTGAKSDAEQLSA